jgi:hypothetical protein
MSARVHAQTDLYIYTSNLRVYWGFHKLLWKLPVAATQQVPSLPEQLTETCLLINYVHTYMYSTLYIQVRQVDNFSLSAIARRWLCTYAGNGSYDALTADESEIFYT